MPLSKNSEHSIRLLLDREKGYIAGQQNMCEDVFWRWCVRIFSSFHSFFLSWALGTHSLDHFQKFLGESAWISKLRRQFWRVLCYSACTHFNGFAAIGCRFWPHNGVYCSKPTTVFQSSISQTPACVEHKRLDTLTFHLFWHILTLQCKAAFSYLSPVRWRKFYSWGWSICLVIVRTWPPIVSWMNSSLGFILFFRIWLPEAGKHPQAP